MTSNDIILLNSTLEQKKKQVSSSLSDSEYFEVFTFEQILKNFDLSYDEIASGRIGGGGDGGIDGFFCLIDGELLDEDTDLKDFKKNTTLELYLIQAKRSPSFSATTVDKINGTVSDIFNLQNDLDDLKSVYDSKLLDKSTIFRKAYLDLASRHPRLKISFVYSTTGDINDIHPSVISKLDVLGSSLQRCFPGANIRSSFIGAHELLDMSRVEKSYTLQLKYLENPISRGENNYVILASVPEYFNFITDENGNLRRYIFESNVRDYQGDTEVNQDILHTLQSDDGMDFWWLNNGITILSSNASVAGKTITMDDVQIVNGLQSSTVIYNYLKDKNPDKKDDDRSVLIRLIVMDSIEGKDRIIKATNFQTAIPAASLKATDRVQRNIEEYLLQKDLYYDRRKNHYKNSGKPAAKIVSIPYLAQCVMAIVLREPDNARARPSSLIKREGDYKRVFNDLLSLDVYLFCVRLMKIIDSFICECEGESVRDMSDLRFHVAMVVAAKLLGNIDYSAKDVAKLTQVNIDNTNIQNALDEVLEDAKTYSVDTNLPIERIAKSRDFVSFVLNKLCI